jgi:predicted permease
MTNWRQDVVYAIRRLRKSPGFAAAAVISIGLGIAANSTIFSMVSAFVLRPAPVGEPSTLFSINTVHRGDCCSDFSYPLYRDVAEEAKSFSGVTAYFPLMPASIGGAGEPVRVWGQIVASNYFDVAQLRMTLGRGFTADEDRTPSVVLSHGLWQRRFGSDPAIVGKAVPVSGRPFTVVGVAPPGFRGLDLALQSELWVPLGMTEVVMPNVADRRARGNSWLIMAARLKSGATLDQAKAEMAGLGQRHSGLYPDSEKDLSFILSPAGTLHPAMRSAVYAFLSALSLVVLLVLCIACANVANLLLAQASARQREMAVRLAMGATRGQLLRQLLTESTLVALAGGGAGVLLSLWATRALSTFQLPMPLPLDLSVSVDWKVLLYTLVLSVGTGIIFGLAPALAASRPILSAALKGEDVLARPGRRWNLRNVLVVAQVTMSMVLLCATGLFLRSLQSASNIEIGFRSKGVTMMAIDPQLHGYSPERTAQFLNTVRERVAALPGVRSAAVTDLVPLSLGGTSSMFEVEGGEKKQQSHETDLYMVSAGYFETLGTPLVQGRDFAGETAAAPRVAVVNEAFARKLFGNSNPIGRRVKGHNLTFEIIGVAKNIKSRTLGESERAVLYRSLAQSIGRDPSFLGYTVAVRVDGNAATVAGAVRNEIRSMDAGLAVFQAETMEEHLRNALFLPRLAGTLFGVFGLVGLLLAAVGLYGVMSYSVSRRKREIGIRMALGAHVGGVQRMIIGQGMVMTAIAMVLGLAAALASAKLASGILYGVRPHDVVTFTAVPAFLGLIAFLATWIPARRAAKVDPMTALRYE